MNMDPIAEEYNYMTPYQFASNNPVWNPVGNTEPSMVMDTENKRLILHPELDLVLEELNNTIMFQQ